MRSFGSKWKYFLALFLCNYHKIPSELTQQLQRLLTYRVHFIPKQVQATNLKFRVLLHNSACVTLQISTFLIYSLILVTYGLHWTRNLQKMYVGLFLLTKNKMVPIKLVSLIQISIITQSKTLMTRHLSAKNTPTITNNKKIKKRLFDQIRVQTAEIFTLRKLSMHGKVA